MRSLAPSSFLSLHPSIADPDPGCHLVIPPRDITQSENVASFGAGASYSRYVAGNRAEHHDNGVMATGAPVNVSSHVTRNQHDLVHREPSGTRRSTYRNRYHQSYEAHLFENVVGTDECQDAT